MWRATWSCIEGRVDMNTPAKRYAIYFTPPPESGWWAFGCRWLGRDPASGRSVEQPRIPGVPPAQLAEFTADARRYGFHATLKPPFTLSQGLDEGDIDRAVATLACAHAPFCLGPMEVRMLGSFIALRPRESPPELQALAQDCVESLDALRAAPDAAELARRRSGGLTPRQGELLERWGYPYVLDQWRFHMTLTRSLSRAEAEPLLAWLRVQVVSLSAEPLTVDGLCVFEQPATGAPFRLVRRFGFDGSVRDYRRGAVTLSARG